MALNKVEDPNSNITKQTIIEEDSSGTKKTTTVENKTNNPKWRGENPSEIFDKAEFDLESGKNAITMTHPSGSTIKAYSPEEIKLFEQDGYVSPNTKFEYPEVGDASVNTAEGFNDWIDEYNSRPEMKPSQFFDNPMIDTDAMGYPIQDQRWDGYNINTDVDRVNAALNESEGMGSLFDRELAADEAQAKRDHERMAQAHAKILHEQHSRDLAESLHEQESRNLASQIMAANFIADDMAREEAENKQLDAIFDDASYWNDMQDDMIQQEEANEADSRRMAKEFKEADSRRMAKEFKEADSRRMAKEFKEADESRLAKDHEEVNKSEAGKAVVKEFQDRINKGANPEQEIKKFIESSGQLKEWRPNLFKAILGTLAGVASGESFGAAATAGFGLVGEDIATQEKVDADIAKETRKHQRELELKGIEAGAKALTARKDLLKFTTKQINDSANNFQQEFFRSMDKDMKEKLNKKVPDVTSAYKTALSSYATKLSEFGINENDLMLPQNERVKTFKRIFDSGIRDWMKALRAQAQGDEDIAISSSPDAFIRARSYHSKLGEDGRRNGNIAALVLDDQGNLDAESLLTLRDSTESLVRRSDNFQNSDEVFKSLISIWRKLKAEDRKDMNFLEFANSQVHQLK